jgi:hypothetical protein
MTGHKLDLTMSAPMGMRYAGHKIVYTLTDEAPMLATYAFLPIIKRYHFKMLKQCCADSYVQSCIRFQT